MRYEIHVTTTHPAIHGTMTVLTRFYLADAHHANYLRDVLDEFAKRRSTDDLSICVDATVRNSNYGEDPRSVEEQQRAARILELAIRGA